MGNAHWKRWKVIIEDKSGKQFAHELAAQQLKCDAACLVFIIDGTIAYAFAPDVWVSVERLHTDERSHPA